MPEPLPQIPLLDIFLRDISKSDTVRDICKNPKKYFVDDEQLLLLIDNFHLIRPSNRTLVALFLILFKSHLKLLKLLKTKPTTTGKKLLSMFFSGDIFLFHKLFPSHVFQKLHNFQTQYYHPTVIDFADRSFGIYASDSVYHFP